MNLYSRRCFVNETKKSSYFKLFDDHSDCQPMDSTEKTNSSRTCSTRKISILEFTNPPSVSETPFDIHFEYPEFLLSTRTNLILSGNVERDDKILIVHISLLGQLHDWSRGLPSFDFPFLVQTNLWHHLSCMVDTVQETQLKTNMIFSTGVLHFRDDQSYNYRMRCPCQVETVDFLTVFLDPWPVWPIQPATDSQDLNDSILDSVSKIFQNDPQLNNQEKKDIVVEARDVVEARGTLNSALNFAKSQAYRHVIVPILDTMTYAQTSHQWKLISPA